MNINAKEFLLDEGREWPEGSLPFRVRVAALTKELVAIDKEEQDSVVEMVDSSKDWFCEQDKPVLFAAFTGLIACWINNSTVLIRNK